MADLDIAAFLRARETEREASAQADLADPSSLHARRKRAEWTLADVKAKRQILDEHLPANPDAEPREGYPGWPDKPWFYCKTCGSGEANEYPRDWPCRTLRLLALPYVGHPDFREEWKL